MILFFFARTPGSLLERLDSDLADDRDERVSNVFLAEILRVACCDDFHGRVPFRNGDKVTKQGTVAGQDAGTGAGAAFGFGARRLRLATVPGLTPAARRPGPVLPLHPTRTVAARRPAQAPPPPITAARRPAPGSASGGFAAALLGMRVTGAGAPAMSLTIIFRTPWRDANPRINEKEHPI